MSARSDRFYNSKFYPVDPDRKLIYDDPQRRASACDLNSPRYRNTGTVGIRGSRLNNFASVYAAFTIVAVKDKALYREAHVSDLTFEDADAFRLDSPDASDDLAGVVSSDGSVNEPMLPVLTPGEIAFLQKVREGCAVKAGRFFAPHHTSYYAAPRMLALGYVECPNVHRGMDELPTTVYDLTPAGRAALIYAERITA